MPKPELPDGYAVANLTREYAERNISQLLELANTIPMVEYTSEEILAEVKDDRSLHAKWQHGLVVVHDAEPIGLVAAYERRAGGTPQYPENTIYVSELAVDAGHRRQGIARTLLSLFFEKNDKLGFVELEGNLTYSIQTNAAAWNRHVIDLYRDFAFTPRATKEYPNRTDLILGRRI